MQTNYYIPSNLLTTNNAKTKKGEKKGWTTHILYMAPHKQNAMKKNVCSHASAGCAAACLFGSGRAMYSGVQRGRTNKTEYFLNNQAGFMAQIVKELTKITAKKGDSNVAVRLNGTSDIPYENIIIRDGKNIFQLFPDLTFYDYTKNHTRFKKELPANYSLVFSRSEINEEKALELLASGVNVAMVFETVPTTYKGYPVSDGDESDLRFLEQRGFIIGLKYKKLTIKGGDNEAGLAAGFVISKEEVIAEGLSKLAA